MAPGASSLCLLACTGLIVLVAAACSPAGPAEAQPSSGGNVPTPVTAAAAADESAARRTARLYVDLVTAGDFTGAWDMLGPATRTQLGSAEAFADQRRVFMNLAGNTVVIGDPTRTMEGLGPWIGSLPRDEVQLGNAFAVELEYPVIKTNDGWEVIVVAPDVAEDWKVWIVR